LIATVNIDGSKSTPIGSHTGQQVAGALMSYHGNLLKTIIGYLLATEARKCFFPQLEL